MSYEIDSHDDLLNCGLNVVDTKALRPCYTYICSLLEECDFYSVSLIMSPKHIENYSLLLCVSILRTTYHHKEFIPSWTRFKLLAQYKAYKTGHEDEMKTMFMGL